jgi:hypothetical protein
VTERLSRRGHWVRPSSARPACLRARVWVSLEEETAERGIKEAQVAMTHVTVKIPPNDKGKPLGKLAVAELHLTTGPRTSK